MQESLFGNPLELSQALVAVSRIKPPELNGASNMVLKNVQTLGVLQAVLLKPCELPDFDFEVIDGNRRLFSALKFNLTEIPALITDGTSGQIAAARVVANVSRSPNPVQEARALRAALQETGLPVEEFSRQVGLPLNTVKMRLKLTELPDDVLDLVGERVSVGVAERMANLNENYLEDAVRLFRMRTAEPAGKFTAEDLKNVKRVQKTDLGDLLSQVVQAVPLITPIQSAEEQLVDEVIRLCAARNADVNVVLKLLKKQAKPAEVERSTA